MVVMEYINGQGGTEFLARKHGIKSSTSIKDWVTKYKHLGDILVRKGQKVKQGAVIGRVGVTGMSFAPHLHYEVWLNDEMMDPMNYYFGTITPQMFMDMAVIVANTGQSLD
jgi:murein DD-endopeptidase MepM/ murein hydrolase activator NlpD